MSYPGAYPPAPPGYSQSAIIAAPMGDPLAEAIAASLRNLGWQVVVTDQFAPYSREARVCVVPLTPMSVSGPSVSAALANPPAPLIPLVAGSTPLPPAQWATAPIIFSGDPVRTAQDIARLAGGAPATPAMPMSPAPNGPSGYGQSPGAPFGMGGYAAPSMPLGASTPTFPPSQPFQRQPTVVMPYASGPTQVGQPTQPGYPPQYAPAGVPYGQPAALAPKRSRWPWIVGGILLAVILLCSCGGLALYQFGKQAIGQVSTGVSATLTAQANASETPAATATSGVPAGFTQYSDSTRGYSMAYPTSWTKSTAGGFLTLGASDSAAAMVVGVVGATIPQSDINKQLNDFFTGMAGSGAVTNTTGPTSVTFAGETWTEKSADVTRSGATIHSVVLATNHGSRFYIIGYLAEKSEFASLDSQSFQPILKTFTFTS